MGGRPAKLNEKKGDRDLERERKKQRRHFLSEERHEEGRQRFRASEQKQRRQFLLEERMKIL